MTKGCALNNGKTLLVYFLQEKRHAKKKKKKKKKWLSEDFESSMVQLSKSKERFKQKC